MVTPQIDIRTESELWEPMAPSEAIIRRAAAAVAAEMALGEGDEIGVTLTDDASIAVLNKRWRGKAKATNVLSFPAPASHAPGVPRFLGDIVLAFETIANEARADDKPVEARLAHLMVHGLLHLLGYDHETDREAEVMEGLEARILGAMGIADPYAVEAD